MFSPGDTNGFRSDRLSVATTSGSKSISPQNSGAGSPLTMTADDDSLIVADFQLNFRLGEGAYGTVYSATHSRTNKKFAVKVMQRSSFCGVERQMIQEAVIMQSLRHKHVVQFLKLLRTKSDVYFVMELAEGELFDLIIQSQRFTISTARKYFQQLMSAISYCHSRGVAHRDLKAENLLLDNEGNLLVCDFGFSSKRLPVPEEEDDHRSNESLPEGTIHYMTPEALDTTISCDSNHAARDHFSQDLWAAGVILYFMLSGQLPFDGRDQEETIYLISRCEPNFELLPDDEDDAEVGGGCREYLRHILTRDPMERFTLDQMINHPWFVEDLDASLFEHRFETNEIDVPSMQSTPPESCSSGQLLRYPSLKSDNSQILTRRSSRMFLDFSHSPQESLSPTDEEELIIQRAFKAIDVDGYGDHFTLDELRDALILLKKSMVDSDEVNTLLGLFNSKSSDSVTYAEFRNAWINKDLAHSKHRDSQYFQLYQLANLSHTDCEKGIIRQLRDAFNSVDELHTGVITFPQWRHIFHRGSIAVSDDELRGLLQYWNATFADGSGAITFEDFVAGIVKRDILWKHPLGKKLAIATNLGGFAELRNVDQSVSTGFLVLGMRESLADKLILFHERLIFERRFERQVPSETVLTFHYTRDHSQHCHTNSIRSPQSAGMDHQHVGSSGNIKRKSSNRDMSLSTTTLPPSSQPLVLNNNTIGSNHTTPQANSPSKGACCCSSSSNVGVCQLDIILSPTSCMGYTLIKLRRITGLTADFHECVKFITSALDREREQATLDCCIRGDSELL